MRSEVLFKTRPGFFATRLLAADDGVAQRVFDAIKINFDDLTWLAGTVTSAVLGNAFVCAVISGPHDRYGARLAWLPTLVVLIAAIRSFSGDDERRSYGRAARNSATPAL